MLITALLLSAMAMALAQWLIDGDIQAGAYQRVAILAGQYWRLVSGAWVHLSFLHAALNYGGLAIVLLMFCKLVTPLRQFVALVVIGAMTELVLLIGFSEVRWMVGLSGPLHGLFAYCAVQLLNANDAPSDLDQAWWRGPRFGWILLAGLAVKLLGERWPTQQQPEAIAWLGGPVLTQAHLAGALAGLAIAAIEWLARRIVRARGA